MMRVLVMSRRQSTMIMRRQSSGYWGQSVLLGVWLMRDWPGILTHSEVFFSICSRMPPAQIKLP